MNHKYIPISDIGWMGGIPITDVDESGMLRYDPGDIIQKVKELWLASGKRTQEEVDSWIYIITPYKIDQLSVVILFNECQGYKVLS